MLCLYLVSMCVFVISCVSICDIVCESVFVRSCVSVFVISCVSICDIVCVCLRSCVVCVCDIVCECICEIVC